MGLFDRSSSTTNTTLVDQTETNSQQSDNSGDGSLKFAGIGGGVSLALSSTNDLSTRDSHDIFDSRSSSSSIANSGNTRTTTNTTLSDSGAVAAGRDLGLSGIATANSALTAFQKVNADSISMLSALATKSIDASQTLARDSADSSSGFLRDAISGFSTLAKQTSEGSDDKIARVVGFALAAVAAVVVLPALFKSGGKGVLA